MPKAKKKTNPTEAFNLHQKILALVSASNTSTLVLGELFNRVREEKLYRTLCGDIDATFKDYLSMPEIKKSSGYASLLINLYKYYIVSLNLSYKRLEGIDTLILDKGRRFITKDNADEWLEKFRTLSRSDIFKLIKYGDKDEMTCIHKWEIIPPKSKCKLCGAIKKE